MQYLDKKVKYSLIIPCYNEVKTIEKVLDRIDKSLSFYQITNYEIIVVDDYSVDGSKEKLEKYPKGHNIKIFFTRRTLEKVQQ